MSLCVRLGFSNDPEFSFEKKLYFGLERSPLWSSWSFFWSKGRRCCQGCKGNAYENLDKCRHCLFLSIFNEEKCADKTKQILDPYMILAWAADKDLMCSDTTSRNPSVRGIPFSAHWKASKRYPCTEPRWRGVFPTASLMSTIFKTTNVKKLFCQATHIMCEVSSATSSFAWALRRIRSYICKHQSHYNKICAKRKLKCSWTFWWHNNQVLQSSIFRVKICSKVIQYRITMMHQY